ncbi:MAG: cation:proton antiporter [Pseudobdellovibrionaceae bacterium]|jgi:CPA2 family monovalent cation:H+ antiporter-2|nr:cation:proton antiporter [Pseudobdellovibrionaceae bacterium]
MIPHDMPLLTTIAMGLSAAFICGIIAHKLRLSPIVGYLMAGIIIGPFTPGYVADAHVAEQLSEIGIVLLMFGVGLHFSFKDLMEVRKIALPGAVVQIAVATLLGACVTGLWGWPVEQGLMFGFACSVASTVVLVRAMEDHHLMPTANGRIAVGWLIVEDLFMVLALVFIPVLASLNAGEINHTQTDILKLFGLSIAKLALFGLFMFIVVRKVLPWILNVVAATRSRELFTLAVFAVAVGVAYGAGKAFDVSLALGAFFSGMMIRESHLSHEIAERALPFQDAFAVLFFVAVGMLFNPEVLFERPMEVLSCVLIIIVGKFIASFFIVMMFRYPLKTGLLVSSGLAQIGEFSFILVTLGVAIGLLPPEGRDIILAGALISISLNPAIFWGSRIIYSFVEKHPRLCEIFDMRDEDVLAHMNPQEIRMLKNTVILVGAGHIGSYICENIDKSKTDIVIIDSNRERIENLREEGYHAIAGDAGSEETLREAAIDKAKAMMVVIPDKIEIGRIVNAVKKVKPDIKILVKDRHETGALDFVSDKIDLKVLASEEIGRRMVSYVNDLE